MNQINKKPPFAGGIPKPFNRQAGPPAFRPVATPQAVQRKMANGAMNRIPPLAPPVYRPQQPPRVLQTKSSLSLSPHAATKIVQEKAIAPQRKSPTPPPVYRPEQKRIAQPKMTPAAPAQMNSKISSRNSFANRVAVHAQMNAGSPSARIAQLKQKGSLPSVVQLTLYQSLKDPETTVDVNARADGVFAQAEKNGKKYEQSHLQYAVGRYMNATDGEQVATRVPMATQTQTMHAYPERLGIGTLMVAEAMEYLNRQDVTIFQPDIMQSSGGKLMTQLVSGTKLSSEAMEELIVETDGGVRSSSSSSSGSSGGGCGWLSCLFSWCSKSPEKKPLIESSARVRTYPAIRVNYEATRKTLGPQVSAKFKRLD